MGCAACKLTEPQIRCLVSSALLQFLHFSRAPIKGFALLSPLGAGLLIYFLHRGLAGGSDGKESACNAVCNAGDPGLFRGSGRFPGEDMATHSRILAWRIPWTVEPGYSLRGSRELDMTSTSTGAAVKEAGSMGSLKPQGWEVKVSRKVSKAKKMGQVLVPAPASVCPPVQWEHRAMFPEFFLKEQCRLSLAHPWIQNAWTQIHWSVHSGVTPGLIRAVSYILASLLPLLGLLPPCSRCVGGPCSPLGLGAQRSWRECVR